MLSNLVGRLILSVAALALFAASGSAAEPSANEPEYDVVVYGGTSGGVIAAVQTSLNGKSVVLIEPGRHVGGLTSGGLGATDIGNKAAIGGLSRSFYRRVGEYYSDDAVWKYGDRASYRVHRSSPDEEELWTFEPHVAEKIFRQMLRESGVPVVFEERLDLSDGVQKGGPRITAIVMESGRTFRGKTFIDATYEGDLMAKAGVSYHVGREANSVYGETLNGVQTDNAIHHQFVEPVDPYIEPGDPSSGLLPRLHDDGPGEDGKGDHRVQAYCFRMCTTDAPENRVPWEKPADYDPLQYELLLRNFEAGDHRVPWAPIMMPNRKTDTNNNFAFSTDNIGMNYDYPDGDYQTRDRIFREHLSYQQGLMWTLANHPRVPEHIREIFHTWGLAKDEFTETNHWPHQLYIREARRMISDYVMTQHHCQGRELADDSIGLAAYTMDSHHVQRYVDQNGHARNEGDVQVGGFSPYPIAYRSIRPRKSECTNLLVPVCLSASHIAYGSIRMEPVFMVLGQSAATAACQALDTGVAVQDIDIEKLQKRLLEEGQVLEWTGARRNPPVEPGSLPGIVIDDRQAEVSGIWLPSLAVGGFVGQSYRHDSDNHKGESKAVFRATLPEAGLYEVRISWTPNSNRATNVPVTIETAKERLTVRVDQTKSPAEGMFEPLGTFRFDAGTAASVTISNAETDGHVIVDSVQFLPVDGDAK